MHHWCRSLLGLKLTLSDSGRRLTFNFNYSLIKLKFILIDSQQTQSIQHLASKMVYLDYNATTPLADEVIQAITHSLSVAWGNPSSCHDIGTKANHVIKEARQHVASMIGAKATDIIFTSGGTEGNNWILQTAVQHYQKAFEAKIKSIGDMDVKRNKPHFITSNIEHDSIKLVLEHFKDQEIADVTFLPVSKSSGAVHVEDVVAAVTPSTVMISIMLANNETGVIQPISDIGRRIKSINRQRGDNQRILLHTDAAQAIGKIGVNVEDLGVDYLTIVGHKFYGPRIGAVYVLNPGTSTPLYPLFFGGGQERNLRPGTENTPMIAGLGKAAELVHINLDLYSSKMQEVRDYLEEKLESCFGDSVCFNGRFKDSQRLPNTCNVSFIGKSAMPGHEILSQVPSIQASVGAACHAQDRPSHILLAIGISDFVARRALRISVGRETTKQDIDAAVQDLQKLFNKT
ncbi:unnamed protein product [Lymnaea stagnalis]|uniref:Selenocysteine lyase n=1 Tax=Lymnaea stagnalis TaxID=6523 RepID=A0AAV2HN75_LYMST